jgi:hypothetical protein
LRAIAMLRLGFRIFSGIPELGLWDMLLCYLITHEIILA